MRQFNSDRRLIVKTAQKLVEKGYLAATGGNISVRIKKGNAFAITPSNRNYMTMTAADICILDEHLNVLSGPWKPSMEAALHGAVYRKSNKLMEWNRHDGSPIRCTAETLLSFIQS